MSDRVLHLTLGPVQGFIAEARRTRDFWAGSFLLSLLTGHAMACVERWGGHVTFPTVDGDPLYEAIRATLPPGERPPGPVQSAAHDTYVGSLPNRFRADVTDCPEDIGKLAREAILTAWGAIEHKVWSRFVEPYEKHGADNGRAPRRIWRRQVGAIWDVAFVVGEPQGDADGRWLDLRKNWRTHYRAAGPEGDEGGDRCRLMGDLQELSGFSKISERESQIEFWNKVSGRRSLDLSAEEPLSAIGMIKRLFPLVGPIDGVMKWQPGGHALSIESWPSVSYVAAVPWLHRAKEVEPATLQLHADAADNALRGAFSETKTQLFGLPSDRFFSMDGALFHLEGVAQTARDCFNEEPQRAADAASRLTQTLDPIATAVSKQAGNDKRMLPSKFYTVLQLDGDRIGARVTTEPQTVRTGLFDFTQRVRKLFDPSGNPHNGVLIYAGGDDVLAVLPVDHALDAAISLHRAYQEAFQDACRNHPEEGGRPETFTLSASIVAAHYQVPLRTVLRQAKHYLEKVAKNRNGRDSLAFALLKPGGVTADWVSAFCREDGVSPPTTLAALGSSDQGTDEAAEFASGFFHSMKARYQRLVVGDEPEEVSGRVDLTPIMIELLVYEYKRQLSGRAKDLTDNEIAQRLMPFREIAIPHANKEEGGSEAQSFAFDAGIIVRFLVSERRTSKIVS